MCHQKIQTLKIMSIETKKPSKNFVFNSIKEDKNAKRKSHALDILFGLLLVAMCALLMSLTNAENKKSNTILNEAKVDVLKKATVSETELNSFSNNKDFLKLNYKNQINKKRNQQIIN